MASLDIVLTVVLGAAIVTALLTRRSGLPITALEIIVGILIVALLGFTLPSSANDLVVLGSLLIVFLAGLETGLGFLRQNLRAAFTIGLPSFFAPFAGLFALLYFGVHAPLLVCVIGATALADTSISIVYTTLNQFGLSELPIGRLVLAATLSVNLLEDASVTTTTFLTAPGLVFTLAILGALLVAALLLPRISRAIGDSGKSSFANEGTRALLFSLAVLSVLSSFVGIPGILFVFLMGLIFAEFADSSFLIDLRKFAFALFVPIYFISVGLKVSIEEIRDHWALLIVLVLVAAALKLLANYLSIRAVLGGRRATSLSVLMNARLTSATVILLLTLTLGIISSEWYSVLIAAVVVLALGSSVALSAFDGFRSRESAVEFFGGEAPAGRPTTEGPVGRGPTSR